MTPDQKAKARRHTEAVVAEKRVASHAPNKKGGSMFKAFPLLVLPWAIYNVLVLATLAGAETTDAAYSLVNGTQFTIAMFSPGAEWRVSWGDVILFIGMICLFFELVKSTSSDNVAIINHSLSLILFIVSLIEFLVLKSFATSVFFFLTVMCLLDVVAGFIVTAISARKDFGAE